MSTTAAKQNIPMVPWWLVLLQGIVLIVLGVLLLTDPGITVVVLIQFLGIYWLIKGIFDIVSIFINHAGWGWKLFSGILGIIAGLIILNHPIWSPLIIGATLVIMLGVLGIVMGGISLVQAFRGGGWGTGILGAVSIVFGLYLLLNVGATTLALPWVLAIFALVGGIAAIVMSFGVRRAEKA